jgi:hypothetical protein
MHARIVCGRLLGRMMRGLHSSGNQGVQMSRNKFKFRREIIAAGGITSTGGIQIGAASTFDSTVKVTGVLTATAAAVLTGGVSSVTGGIIAGTGGYLADVVETMDDNQALTDTGGLGTGGRAILGYGVTAITITGTSGTTAGSTANNLVFKLNSPIKTGVLKEIWITGTSASTKVVSIRTATSTHVFFGGSNNAITLSTALSDGGFPGAVLRLRGLSTTQWAVSGPAKLSTAASFSSATA